MSKTDPNRARSLLLSSLVACTTVACTPTDGDSSTTASSTTEATSATTSTSNTSETTGTTDTDDSTSSTTTTTDTTTTTADTTTTTTGSDTTAVDTDTDTTTTGTGSDTDTDTDTDTEGDPLIQHLVGYWPFNGDSEDHSGVNIDLSFVGDPEYQGSVSAGLGSALSLDGDDAAVGTDFVKLSGDDATIVAWVRAEALEGSWNTIVKNWGTSATGQFHFGLDSGTDNLRSDIPGSVASGEDPIVVGEWLHTTVVIDSEAGLHSIYLNGVLVAMDPYEPPLVPGDATGLGVGAKPNNDGSDASDSGLVGYWIGEIDEVGLYDIALTAEEIATIYDNGMSGVQLDGSSE